jgi:hypothetical protein
MKEIVVDHRRLSGHDVVMVRRGMFGLRALWWWCLTSVTAVGVAVSWMADHFLGATAAGIIATVYFTVVAILFGLTATNPKASTNETEPPPPKVDLPRHMRQTTQPEPARSVIKPAPSISSPVSSTLHEQGPGQGRYSDSSLSLDSDDSLNSKNNLIERLSYSIPDNDYIAQIADEAGLDRIHLRLEGTPSNRWSSLIHRAEIENKERRVLERASRISPDRPLRRAIEDYIGHRP